MRGTDRGGGERSGQHSRERYFLVSVDFEQFLQIYPATFAIVCILLLLPLLFLLLLYLPLVLVAARVCLINCFEISNNSNCNTRIL